MGWSDIRSFSIWFEYHDWQPFQCTRIETVSHGTLYDCRHAPDHEIMPVQEVISHLNRVHIHDLPAPDTGD